MVLLGTHLESYITKYATVSKIQVTGHSSTADARPALTHPAARSAGQL